MLAVTPRIDREDAAGPIVIDNDWLHGWPDDSPWPDLDEAEFHALPCGSDTAPPWAPLQEALPVRRCIPHPPADLAGVADLLRRVLQACIFMRELCPGPTAERHAEDWLHAAARAAAKFCDRLTPDRPGSWPKRMRERSGEDAAREILEWIKAAGVPLAPLPSDAGPFADVEMWADRFASEDQRAVLLAIIAAGGRLKLAGLAAVVGWNAPHDNAWNSMKKRINKKFKNPHTGIPWELRRQANAAVLVPMDAPAGN